MLPFFFRSISCAATLTLVFLFCPIFLKPLFLCSLFLHTYFFAPSTKREGHRLGSTVASIFRSGNRDKPVSTDSIGSSTTKAVVMRPPTSNLNVTGSTNVLRHSSSSRPSLTVLMGSGGNDAFSIDGSGNGSCSSLASQPSMEVLSLLRDLNVIGEEFFSMVFQLRTRNDELEARVLYLETEKDKLQEVHTLAKQHGLFKSTCSRCGGDGGVPDGLDASPGSDAGLFALTVKQGTEKLRQDVENFQRKSEEWEKEYKRQRDSLEREHTKLAKEWARYEDARAELERRQRQYEENCKTLQQQVDLHASRGVKFTGITMPEIQLPDVTTGSSSGNCRRGSSNSMRELAYSDLYAIGNNKPGSLPVHSHSASDDLSNRWAQPSRFAKDLHTTDSPSQLFVKDNETTPRNSLIPSPSVRNDELPMHLRGSLLNQASSS
ncbi:hypothetical protein P879_07737 [Paragonimus westermani]|uniref:Uncharacterized protein n=1 Tax=Paragonimus westermani TaxID=34504 RepID=A0A8T0DG03_9TREM|nr:hypothetical protein P879_07737 [Paragonimus westermani]